jgi:hypothetical protein
MIIVTKPDATEEQIQHILDRIKEWGLKAEVSRGAIRTVIGVIGPEDQIRERPIAAIPGVESATPVLKPYKLVAREFRGGNAGEVKVGGVAIGGREVVLMSGPCSVENREQLVSIAKAIKGAGAKILRGGAFKPRTSPTPFKDWVKKVCACWLKRAPRPGCRSSPRSWTRSTSKSSSSTRIVSRSAHATCRIFHSSRRSADRSSR